MVRETSMSVANTSQHLQTLLEIGLVAYKKQGLYSYYQLADKEVGFFINSLQALAEQRSWSRLILSVLSVKVSSLTYYNLLRIRGKYAGR